MKRTQILTVSNHKGNNSQVEINAEAYVCPFLGMENDPETSFLFVSPGNFCHRLNPPRPVSTGYQGSVCFDRQAFVECPIYKKNWNRKLPEGFAPRKGGQVGNQKLTPGWLVLLLVISLAVLAASIYFFVPVN